MAEKNGASVLETIITGADLAALTGHSERTIKRLTAQGIVKLAHDSKGQKLKNRYVAGEACPRVCEYLRDQVLIDDPHEALYRQSRARKMTALAESEEMRVKLQRHELLDGELVDREVMAVLGAVKNHVLGLPTRCTRQLAPYTGGGENAKFVHRIMTDAARSTLTEASRFDLKKFARQRKSAQRTSKHANGEEADD